MNLYIKDNKLRNEIYDLLWVPILRQVSCRVASKLWDHTYNRRERQFKNSVEINIEEQIDTYENTLY